MIGAIFRAAVATLIVVAIAAVLGLVVMAGVAATHGVVHIPVPSSSYLSSVKADHIDAYRAPLEYNTYRDIARLTAFIQHNGERETYRSDDEIVYEGRAPGVTYFVSYILDRTTNPQTLSMVTAVRIHDRKGRYFWKVFRPVYRRLAPYLLDRLAQSAPD
jgi:hypothetical protein